MSQYVRIARRIYSRFPIAVGGARGRPEEARRNTPQAPTSAALARGVGFVRHALPQSFHNHRIGRSAARVHDVAVAQEVLQRAGVDAVVGELEAAGVAQHVRMNWEGKFGQFSGPADHFEEPGPRHRAAAFRVEDEAALQVLPTAAGAVPGFPCR